MLSRIGTQIHAAPARCRPASPPFTRQPPHADARARADTPRKIGSSAASATLPIERLLLGCSSANVGSACGARQETQRLDEHADHQRRRLRGDGPTGSRSSRPAGLRRPRAAARRSAGLPARGAARAARPRPAACPAGAGSRRSQEADRLGGEEMAQRHLAGRLGTAQQVRQALLAVRAAGRWPGRSSTRTARAGRR